MERGVLSDGRLVDGNDLVQLLHALRYPVCLPGIVRARFSSLRQRLYRISLTRELFPEPDTPVTQVMHAQRKVHVNIFQIIFLRAL